MCWVGIKKALPDEEEELSQCAPGGIRTPNLLIRSQMLYPLSYGRSFAGVQRKITLHCTPPPGKWAVRSIYLG